MQPSSRDKLLHVAAHKEGLSEYFQLLVERALQQMPDYGLYAAPQDIRNAKLELA